jgi:hypothetical protein
MSGETAVKVRRNGLSGETAVLFSKWVKEAKEFITLKNASFWDATPCGSCMKRSFGGT